MSVVATLPIVGQITNGDCVSLMRAMPAGSVPLVFADPPFNIGYDYDVYHDECDDESYLNWTREWMSEVSRVLAPSGTFWLAIGDEYAAEMKLIAQKELKLTCRSWVIWYYTFGVYCLADLTRTSGSSALNVKFCGSFTK